MNNVTSGATQMGVRGLLGIPDFRRLWLAQSVSDFGDSLTTLTMLVLVNQLTGSTAALGLLMILLALPQVTFGLIAGVYVDRLDRKQIMIVSDAGRGLLLLGLAALSLLGQVWPLFLVSFLQASVGTFFTPARNALIPNVVPHQGLLAANSFGQTSRLVAGVAGTATAGLLFGLTNTFWPAFALDGFTFFFSCWLVSQVKIPADGLAVIAPATAKVIFSQLLDGLKIIRGSRPLLGSMLCFSITMLGLGAVNVLLTPLIINDLRVPATWFGALEFVQSGAMILSGVLVAVLATRFKTNLILGAGLSGLGLMISLVALVSSIWHLLMIIFVVGLILTPTQAAASTVMQTNAPNKVRGRVSATSQSLISVSNLISMGLAGTLGDLIGIRSVFVIAGMMAIGAGLLAIWLIGGATRSLPEQSGQEAI